MPFRLLVTVELEEWPPTFKLGDRVVLDAGGDGDIPEGTVGTVVDVSERRAGPLFTLPNGRRGRRVLEQEVEVVAGHRVRPRGARVASERDPACPVPSAGAGGALGPPRLPQMRRCALGRGGRPIALAIELDLHGAWAKGTCKAKDGIRHGSTWRGSTYQLPAQLLEIRDVRERPNHRFPNGRSPSHLHRA